MPHALIAAKHAGHGAANAGAPLFVYRSIKIEWGFLSLQFNSAAISA